MKKITIIIILLFITFSYGQKLDSIPYDYGQIYFHTYGEGEEILMLSGGPGNSAMNLEKVALKLSGDNRIILLEQRGTGRSIPIKFDKTTVSIELAINDINLVLDRLKIDKVILLGHSYGASLASIFTSKFPQRVKSLILVSPGVFDYDSGFISLCNIISRLGKQEAEKWEELFEKSNTNEFTKTEKEEYKYLNRLAYFYDKSKVGEYIKQMDGINNVKAQNLLMRDLINLNFNLKRGLENISVPINIVSGRQDLFDFMAYEYKIAKPEIKLNWIDQSGHFPMFETPNEFYKILKDILDLNHH